MTTDLFYLTYTVCGRRPNPMCVLSSNILLSCPLRAEAALLDVWLNLSLLHSFLLLTLQSESSRSLLLSLLGCSLHCEPHTLPLTLALISISLIVFCVHSHVVSYCMYRVCSHSRISCRGAAVVQYMAVEIPHWSWRSHRGLDSLIFALIFTPQNPSLCFFRNDLTFPEGILASTVFTRSFTINVLLLHIKPSLSSCAVIQ